MNGEGQELYKRERCRQGDREDMFRLKGVVVFQYQLIVIMMDYEVNVVRFFDILREVRDIYIY